MKPPLKRPFSPILYSWVMIVSGIIMSFYCGYALARSPLGFPSFREFFYNTQIFFYTRLPSGFQDAALTLRLVIAFFQVMGGIFLLRRQRLGLFVLRALTAGFMAVTVLNPFYPDYVAVAFLVWHSLFLYTLFHPNADNLLRHGNRKSDLVQKSRLAILLGCFEMIFALGLLRVVLWMLSTPDFSFYFSTKIGLSFLVTVPKDACFMASLLMFLTGALTVTFRRMGRMLNILLCDIIFLTALAAIFLVDNSYLEINAVLYGIIGAIFLSVVVFFLLTNPAVKKQFESQAKGNVMVKFLGILLFGMFLTAAFQFSFWGKTLFPEFFDTTAIKGIVRDTKQWKDSVYNKYWNIFLRQILESYRAPRTQVRDSTIFSDSSSLPPDESESERAQSRPVQPTLLFEKDWTVAE